MKFELNRWWKAQPRRAAKVLVLLALLSLAAGGGYWLAVREDTGGPLPAATREQMTFSPLVLPLDAKGYGASEYKFSTAEGDVQILSYIVTAEDGNKINVSQYPQPPQFAEIPEYKDRFLTNIAKQYETVQTANGTIYLGRLERQNNKQLGVMIERGLLVLMSPEKEMQANKWRNLGDQLEIQRIVN